MQDFPHHYRVEGAMQPEGNVPLSSAGLPDLETAPPAEFGGPGDRWSPETLLLGAIADCFLLSFRAVARASRLEWRSIRCEIEGTLDRVERETRFTGYRIAVHLRVPAETDEKRARRAIEKAETACLISASLRDRPVVEATVEYE